MLWLTNYTSVNLAVIQACDTTTVEPGVYDCFFLTNSATPLYYVTGSGIPQNGGYYYNYPISLAIVNFPNASPPTWAGSAPWSSFYGTNGFEVQAMENNSQAAPGLVQILVQPQ